ncbi:efflux RND transporter permease subunit [Zoogloea dura]|uniref:Efflux RND transporter permease subunit n=1 Tax=Zoogloea dura TaxID=2728840 RepID=A0A848G1G5_9RHOO|nr:efflux RND transporter permease subunit [Zoogloea dura]NML25124.1 efflux RND transporter permease subunit [Zoogloea dura]
MNFSALSIRNPIPAILLFALLTLAGLLAFRGSGVQDFPDIELPVVTVSASLPGAAPGTLETEVARKLENSIATLAQIKKMYTTILDGEVTISIEFELEKNANEAETEVRAAVSRVRSDLPADVREPVVAKILTAGRPLGAWTLTSPTLDEEALSWLVDDTITRRLLAVKGVGAVKRMGGLLREVRVELDADRMAALGVSAADVSRQLRRSQLEAPGGRGDVGGGEQAVRTIATVASAADLATMDVPLPDGRSVRLERIARITDTTAERRSVALLDGKQVVGFEVSRTKGASEITVAAGVQKAIDELQAAHPELRIVHAYDNVAPVQENFDGSMQLLYEGALLAVLVVWWFLRDWRSTLVAAMALPLSVIPTFLGMYWFGFTLNTVTLLSMALVVGILVDDAIVEIENIARHLRMGKTPVQAAMEAADEIGLAVIATTFALVAVFLPTAFMAGIAGKFFKQFGWTAVLAILASLVVARLLTPMMAAYFLKPVAHGEVPEGRMMRAYMRSMQWCLRHRFVTLLGAIAFFVGSVMLIPLLPTGFVPPADRAQTLVNVELPPGSTLRETWDAAEQARAAIGDMPDVKAVFSSVGGGAAGDGFNPGAAAEVRRAVLTVTLSHRTTRPRNQQAVEVEMRERLARLPGMRITVGPADSGVKMILVLKSDDPAALATAAQAATRDLRTLQGVGNITSSASLVRPEVVLRPDFARAADLGVSAESIGETVRIATAGDYDVGLAKLNLERRQVPIRVKLNNDVRADLEAIGRLSVPGRHGPVQLANVADIRIDSGPAQVNRMDRSRNVILEVELGQRELGEVYNEALALPALRNLPPGVRLADSGDAEMMQELFGSFGLAMGIGVLCIYMVLVLLFKGFTQPVTILAALPLAIGGAFVALLATRSSFSMPSLIGLLMLMGVVTKNSILLIEYAIEARRGRGGAPMNRFDALVDACRKRARPIVMTSLAMGAGMLPIAMGLGADPSFRAPMAIAVIGGLISSTLLSLLVVPAVYTYVDDLEDLIARLNERLRGRKRPAVAVE